MSFEAADFEKKIFNCTFEKSFYKTLLNTPLHKKPSPNNYKLVRTLPSQYKPSIIITGSNKKTDSLNIKYLPYNIIKSNNKKKFNYFYISELTFKELTFFNKFKELSLFNNTLKEQGFLINNLR
jgi:hypothetical protein